MLSLFCESIFQPVCPDVFASILFYRPHRVCSDHFDGRHLAALVFANRLSSDRPAFLRSGNATVVESSPVNCFAGWLFADCGDAVQGLWFSVTNIIAIRLSLVALFADAAVFGRFGGSGSASPAAVALADDVAASTVDAA